MLTIINDLPGNVLGIEAGGEVTGADYENVLIPAVEEKLKANKKLRLLYYLGQGFTGFSLEAMLDDAGVGLKHFTAWDRVALVSDNHMINGLAKFFGHLLPGEVKIFNSADQDEATRWIAQF